MTQFDQLRSADYSPFLVHFTRSTGFNGDRPIVGAKLIDGDHQLAAHLDTTALDKLMAILGDKEIKTSPQPDLPHRPEAACFTESVWGSITFLTDAFSSYGLGFNKRFVFERGGGPALYTRGDIVVGLSTDIPLEIEPFVKPFDPDATWLNVPSNFLFEREWRIPSNLVFNYVDLEFVLVDSYRDVDRIIRTFGSQNIREDKIIVMESHRRVRETWGGQHL